MEESGVFILGACLGRVKKYSARLRLHRLSYDAAYRGVAPDSLPIMFKKARRLIRRSALSGRLHVAAVINPP
eukprot:3936426-Prymnesium_polylepis.1